MYSVAVDRRDCPRGRKKYLGQPAYYSCLWPAEAASPQDVLEKRKWPPILSPLLYWTSLLLSADKTRSDQPRRSVLCCYLDLNSFLSAPFPNVFCWKMAFKLEQKNVELKTSGVTMGFKNIRFLFFLTDWELDWKFYTRKYFAFFPLKRNWNCKIHSAEERKLGPGLFWWKIFTILYDATRPEIELLFPSVQANPCGGGGNFATITPFRFRAKSRRRPWKLLRTK